MKSIIRIGLMLMALVPAVIARGQSILPTRTAPEYFTLPIGYPNKSSGIHDGVGGLVYYYTNSPDGTIDKPIIIPEGFDPENKFDWRELSTSLNEGQGTMSCLLAKGYDFVIINYNDGGNFLEHNAYLFARVVQIVNSIKVSGEKNIVIGPGMGGLVARYGLAYMESQNINHDTRLFVSMDAPQYGANVPLGLQKLIRYFSDKKGKQNDDAAKKYKILQSPAAREMLLYHVDADESQAHPLRISFDQNLHALGDWPKKLRKVGMSNGSGWGLKQLKDDNVTRLQPSDEILDFKYFDGDISENVIFGRVYTLSDHVRGLIARVKAAEDVFPNEYYVVNFRPMDNMAGGYRAFSGEMENIENTAKASKQCFIPLFSALAIATNDDHYSVFNDPNVMSKTWFDAIYCPAENEQHCQITAASNNWLFNEIVTQTLSVSSNNFLQKGNVDLQAKGEVRLLPGFSSGTNPTFHIFVGPFAPCFPGAPLATDENTATTVATGIETVENSSDEISVYPNPASDFIIIAAQGQELKQIELMQADGKLLKTIQPQQGNYQLNLDDVHAGMYFIRVIGSKENVVKKIVVTH
jgi:hypothetical protein